MAKKIKKQLREYAENGITKDEFQAIMEATGASSQQVVKRMDSMNQNGNDVRLNSGAANMLIKGYQDNPYSQYYSRYRSKIKLRRRSYWQSADWNVGVNWFPSTVEFQEYQWITIGSFTANDWWNTNQERWSRCCE